MINEKTKPEDLELSNNIEFKFYYWGPLLMKFKVSDSLCDELLRRSNKLTMKEDDARSTLVSTIEKELSFRDEDKEYFVTNTSKIFNTYLDHLNKKWQNNKKVKTLFMKGLWINFMKKNDFNPLHEHSGDLSFVLFCDVPDELKIENKKNITQSEGAGSLCFTYGDGMPDYICQQSFLPEKGDFFIFPAKLQHWVHPFKSDITRISVAGNMEFQYQ